MHEVIRWPGSTLRKAEAGPIRALATDLAVRRRLLMSGTAVVAWGAVTLWAIGRACAPAEDVPARTRGGGQPGVSLGATSR